MKILKFAICALAGSLALLANRGQAATVGVPITISLTTYSQVTSTNSSGAITFSTNSTTWNNATILAKIQTTLGITLPAGAKLGISTINSSGISAGNVVILDKAGNILYDVDDFETDTGFVQLYFNIDAVVQVTKTAKLSSTTQFSGVGDFYAYFDLFGVEPSDASVQKKGFFEFGVIDYFDFVDVAASGAITKGTGIYVGLDTPDTNPTTGSVTGSGAGEYGHFDDASFTETFQPADGTFSGSASAVPFNTYPFFHSNEED
jgi:hypothetical protein